MLHSRKLIAFLLALVLLLSLAACTNEEDGQDPNNDAVSDDGNVPDDGSTPDDGNTPDENGELGDGSASDENGENGDEANPDETNPDNTDEPDSGAADSDIDLTAFFDTLNETYDLSSTADMDETLTESYLPGLSDITLRQSVLKTPMISAVVCEILLVECENSEDVAAVEEIFQARIQTQIDGGAWYPASIETWEGAQVVSSGNYVALFAHENADAMAEDFRALFAE